MRDAVETRIEEWVFRTDYAERMLREQFGVTTLDVSASRDTASCLRSRRDGPLLARNFAKGPETARILRRRSDNMDRVRITSRPTLWCSTP